MHFWYSKSFQNKPRLKAISPKFKNGKTLTSLVVTVIVRMSSLGAHYTGHEKKMIYADVFCLNKKLTVTKLAFLQILSFLQLAATFIFSC